MSAADVRDPVRPWSKWRILLTGAVIAWALVLLTSAGYVRLFGLGGLRLVTAETVFAVAVFAWGATVPMLAILQYVPWEWRFRHIQTGMLSVGGGESEGHVMLATAMVPGPSFSLSGPKDGTPSGISLNPGPVGAGLSLHSSGNLSGISLGWAAHGQGALWLTDRTTGTTAWSVRLDADGRAVVRTGPEAAVPLGR